MQLITQAEFRQVRAAIAPELVDDVGVLPDEVIGADVYAGAAVREVLAIDPLAGTRTDDALARVKTAAVLFCAARLAPRVASVIRESIGPYSIWTSTRDFEAIAEALRAQALALLGLNVPEISALSYRPAMFALAPGGRGDVAGRLPTDLSSTTIA